MKKIHLALRLPAVLPEGIFKEKDICFLSDERQETSGKKGY